MLFLQNSHKPKWVKMRYGAWYLNTKLWKKQRADEPLVDPKVLGRAQDENLAKELREQVCVYTETQSSELKILTVQLPPPIEVSLWSNTETLESLITCLVHSAMRKPSHFMKNV